MDYIVRTNRNNKKINDVYENEVRTDSNTIIYIELDNKPKPVVTINNLYGEKTHKTNVVGFK